MRFKRETWQPTIGDKYILVVTNEKAIALDKSDSKNLTKYYLTMVYISKEK